MSNREKIIIFLTLAAAVYGLVDFLLLGGGDGNDRATSAQTVNATQLSRDLAQDEPTAVETYILERVSKTWSKDPFYLREQAAAPTAEKQEAVFVYSGFVDYGGVKVAVINGLEYEVGDELEQSGYVVRSISSDHVVLEDTVKSGEVKVPFEQDMFFPID